MNDEENGPGMVIGMKRVQPRATPPTTLPLRSRERRRERMRDDDNGGRDGTGEAAALPPTPLPSWSREKTPQRRLWGSTMVQMRMSVQDHWLG